MKVKVLFAGALVALSSLQSFAKGPSDPVYDAAARGDVVKLKELLAADPSMMATRNAPNRGLLCVAAMAGQKDAVEFLISQGANVNEKGFEELTPLADMAMYGTRDDQKCAEVAAVLLAHGAEVDPIDAYHATPLMHAVESKKSQLATVLLEHGAGMNHRFTGAMGESTLLQMAVYDKDKDMVAVLLKFKAPVDAVNRDGATALDIAEQRDETEIAAMLREADPEAAKRSPHYTTPPTKDEMRALGRRIADGDDSAFDELANTAQKLYSEIKDYQREQPRVIVLLGRMHAAFDVLGEEAGKGNEKALAALKKCLSSGRLASFAPDAVGVAAAGGNKEAFEILSHYQNWHIDEFSAQFAICQAAKANFEPAIDYVANLVSVQNAHDFSGGVALEATNALAKAAENGNQKAKDALQKFFASATPASTTEASTPYVRPPRDPNVPAHWSYLIGDKEALDRVLASTNLMMARDDNAQTALEWAVKSHKADFARMFLEHGAPIPEARSELDSADPRMDKWTKNYYLKSFNSEHALLTWAVIHNDEEMTSLLLEFHASPDAADQDGNTALHLAVTARNKEMVKLLLDAKSALNPTNHEGATPLFLADSAENMEIADLIIQAAAARGETVSGVNAPSRAELRLLAQRICDGNVAAIGDLRDTVKLMYSGVDARKDHARVQTLANRMDAAFHLLGEEAGKGNDNAFQALKGFLKEKDMLGEFTPYALGTAAAAGHEEALKILLNYRQWGILDSSGYLALQAPAEAGRQPAVDVFIALLKDPEAARKQFYGVAWLAKRVAQDAAARGDQKAKAALEEFAANQPELNSHLR